MSTETFPTDRPADRLRDGDTEVTPGSSAAARKAGGVAGWIDDRTSAAKGVNYLLKKVFPDHWSFMLGEIAMYSLIICLISGALLTLWFVPSAGQIVYDGSFVPLRGQTMSEAYASTLDISFDIPGGLLVRQIHHWAALMFVVGLTVHMFRVFFTGAFRKPRELNWVIGTVLALLAAIEGFAGYSLPDDLLSGTGLRAMEGFVQTAPVIGSYLAFAIFGGPFPGEAIIPRLYSAHVLLIPALLVGLFTAHIVLVAVQKHTQFPGPGRTNDNVVGYRVMPVYAAKAGGFFFIVFGIIALISALFTINPIWAYGPYDPSPVTAGFAARLVHGCLRRRAAPAARVAGVRVPRESPCRSTSRWVRSCCCRWSTSSSACIPSSSAGSPATPASTTCSTVPATTRPAPASAWPGSSPTRCSCSPPATTSSPSSWACRSTTSRGSSGSGCSSSRRWRSSSPSASASACSGTTASSRCTRVSRVASSVASMGRTTSVTTPSPTVSAGSSCSTSPCKPLELTPDVDENGVARPAARKDRLRAKVSHFYFKDAVNPVTPAELAAAHHDGQHAEAIEAPSDHEGIDGSGGHGADTDAGASESRGISSGSPVRE